jgi:hypothetical protein
VQGSTDRDEVPYVRPTAAERAASRERMGIPVDAVLVVRAIPRDDEPDDEPTG